MRLWSCNHFAHARPCGFGSHGSPLTHSGIGGDCVSHGRRAEVYFGESNKPTPEYIKRAAQKAMADGFTFYTENAGILSRDKRSPGIIGNAGRDPRSRLQIVITSRRTGAQCRHSLRPRSRRRSIVLTPAWPNGSSIVAMCNAQ